MNLKVHVPNVQCRFNLSRQNQWFATLNLISSLLAVSQLSPNKLDLSLFPPIQHIY